MGICATRSKTLAPGKQCVAVDIMFGTTETAITSEAAGSGFGVCPVKALQPDGGGGLRVELRGECQSVIESDGQQGEGLDTALESGGRAQPDLADVGGVR